MAEDQGGEEVIREIGKALALASELDPQIVRSLRSAIVLDRPGFRRQLGAIINGNERGVYDEQAVHG
jgi:hypothetical protein